MKRPTGARMHARALIGIAFSLGVAALAMSATATEDGAATVRGLYATLLATMRNGATLGASGRYAQIEPTVRRSFDIPLMTRLAVGPQWAELSAAQRGEVAHAFERYITAVYADRFRSYAGEQLEVTGERVAGGGVIVTSRIIDSDGKPVAIDYLMRDNGGQWQIADVYLDGTISEMATRRSDFASILRSGGIDGLIQALNLKADRLTAAQPS